MTVDWVTAIEIGLIVHVVEVIRQMSVHVWPVPAVHVPTLAAVALASRPPARCRLFGMLDRLRREGRFRPTGKARPNWRFKAFDNPTPPQVIGLIARGTIRCPGERNIRFHAFAQRA